MKKRRLKIPVSTIIIILILLSAIYIFLKFLSGFLWTSEYFNIKTVKVNEKDIDLSFLLGKNIFALDLKKEAKEISTMYPNYYKVRLVRQLPNGISVKLEKRKPLAYLRLYRYFAIDEEAVLFNLDSDNALNPNLPIILGLETKIFGPKGGKRYCDIKELALCLDLIREIKGIRGLKDYKIKKIDVSFFPNFSFYILENIEIKIGTSNINHKLRLLNSILTNPRQDLSRIQYIDLRFKEPVIKYKYEK